MYSLLHNAVHNLLHILLRFFTNYIIQYHLYWRTVLVFCGTKNKQLFSEPAEPTSL